MARADSTGGTDYSPVLHVHDDGHIWWRWKDAVLLAAGHAPSPSACRDRARAIADLWRDKRGRIDFPGGYHQIAPRPRMVCHGGRLFVRAREFLDWLTVRHEAGLCEVTAPAALVQAVTDAQWRFDPVAVALDGWFDRPVAQLPDKVLLRAAKDIGPGADEVWDDLGPEARRKLALCRDDLMDPDAEPLRKKVREDVEAIEALERRIAEWESVATPAAHDLAIQENRLTTLRADLDRLTAPASTAQGVEAIAPLQRQPAQEQIILDEIRRRGLDPLALPPGEPGKRGVRAEIGDAVMAMHPRLFTSRKAFTRAWERLQGKD